MKVNVTDGGKQPQCRAELEGSNEEETGHARAREGGVVPGGRLEGGGVGGHDLEGGGGGGVEERPGSKVERSGIWDQGGTCGGHTIENVISKGRSLLIPYPMLRYWNSNTRL